jgi:hypothetical protein
VPACTLWVRSQSGRTGKQEANFVQCQWIRKAQGERLGAETFCDPLHKRESRECRATQPLRLGWRFECGSPAEEALREGAPVLKPLHMRRGVCALKNANARDATSGIQGHQQIAGPGITHESVGLWRSRHQQAKALA